MLNSEPQSETLSFLQYCDVEIVNIITSYVQIDKNGILLVYLALDMTNMETL